MSAFKFIEHIKEGLTDWVKLEYSNMIKQAGHKNLILTSLTPSTLAQYPPNIQDGAVCTSLSAVEYVTSQRKGIASELTQMDPPDSVFDFLLFGGNDPPRDRTKELRMLGFEGRHLGPIQMTTDTAVMVAKRIVDGKRLQDIEFVDKPELQLRKGESVEMPFRYIVENGQPLVPAGFLDLLRKTNDQPLDLN
ncbi:SAM-dependent RNA methyltransferase [Chytriomyces cf. hyalinus JEL632]|nr:SAM-dependent RNA methyltransferase [Chytriomyces cf. hyalinus JEL632]